MTKQIKWRVLTINEVGHTFELSLKLDKKGVCYVVFPDCPPFLIPSTNMATLGAMIGFGHHLGAPMGFETFNGTHVLIALALILFCLYMALCIIF